AKRVSKLPTARIVTKQIKSKGRNFAKSFLCAKLTTKDKAVPIKNNAPNPSKRKFTTKKGEGAIPVALKFPKSSMPIMEPNPRPEITWYHNNARHRTGKKYAT